MWRVVYLAQTKEIADSISDLLSREGFWIKVKPVYRNVSIKDNYYEILIPESEAEEVHTLLMENGY
ncbi:MAG TPA: hypothetical protein DIW17_11600 [Clostridiales bacterium]|nr:hypothetical protein [Clostridia bacterium]MDD4679430.1 hypothetical protein [Clostridia bacterium]HCS74503.1 hypothetical protein [Clostridiales bacterium]